MGNVKTKKSTLAVVTVGILAAIVFVSNYLSIPIPISVGDVTRIHLANGMCLLAGIIAGPIGGGLAAGIGSALYDIFDPIYITSAPFTFVFKFLMAFVAGHFAKRAPSPKSFIAILGSILGQLLYVALYLGKTYVTRILAGSAPEAIVPELITKLGVSLTNAAIAVVIASVLSVAVISALKKSGMNTENLKLFSK